MQAVGTSRELKHQFGIGYHLVVEMSAIGRVQDVEQLVTAHIPKASKETVEAMGCAQAQDHAAMHVERFAIPFSEMEHCGPMLLQLEDRKESMGVRDFSLETSSLEEVFMILGKQAEEQRQSGPALNVDFGDVERETILAGNHRQECSPSRNVRAIFRLKWKACTNSRQAAFVGILSTCLLLSVAVYTDSNYSISLYPPLAFALATLSSAREVIQDREKKVKFIMLAHGVRPCEYWIGTLLFSSLSLSIVSGVFVVLYIIMTPPGVGSGPTLMIALMAVINPFMLVLFAFNAASLFESTEIAMKILPLAFMFLGWVPCAVVWFLTHFVHSPITTTIATVLHCVFSFTNPIYSFGGMLVYVTQTNPDIAHGQLSVSESFASWAAVPLYAAPIVCLVLGLNLVRMDISSYTTLPGDFRAFGDLKKDDDVLAEERRIAVGVAPVHADAVRYQGLNHTYRRNVHGKWKQTYAVRGVSLGISPGECFGLLGPNGAGKTTTLAVLTGDVRPPTAGRVTIFGHDISTTSGAKEAFKLLGVCPQVDAIIEDVSGRDQLLFHGRIKGVPEAQLGVTVDRLLQRLGLDSFDAAKDSSTYSGGMKRKLSVGISLVGDSPILFMDEPTAAVDAAAKRHLWKVIQNRTSNQTVVLTTHSMEEAEALCDRLAIQVKGQLRCLGTPMSIRNAYGYGYQLEIFASPPGQGLVFGSSHLWAQGAHIDRSQMIRDFVIRNISNQARLLDSRGERFLFQLPPLSQELTLGNVLTQITTNKAAIGIEDWSIVHPTLEQVFLRFAKEQDEGDCESNDAD
eukprot:TRINITY_DN4170_c0_g3_i1.p1 TRINITY_DN4170_c0_g3~~TRINITY_DN4170_c0_g3_i1.p1  ORF type:complete len:926 (-),score=131.83 TRINITY_DN4170_c0_g3_i1:257-2650(-)